MALNFMSPRWQRLICLVSIPLLLSACEQSRGYDQAYDDLIEAFQENKLGSSTDHWIEMKNIMGEWEKTGIIFGYGDDFEQCQNAIEGLKIVSFPRKYPREFRCTPVQSQ